MPRRRSLRVAISMSGGQSVREQQIEDAKRRHLGQRPCIADRPHAARASVFALTFGDQPPRRLQNLVVHPEYRLAESNTASVVVVDEDPRMLGLGIERNADV